MGHQTLPKSSITAAIYQSNLADASLAVKLDRLNKTISNAPGADLVICPELFLSGYRAGAALPTLAESADEFSHGVVAIARSNNCAIVYGYPEAENDRLYNSARAIAADGRIVANHRKLRLPGGYEKTWFTCGNALTGFVVGGWHVALVICYDLEFPEVVRACTLKGAHLVVAPTALSENWSVVSEKVVPTRAFENGVFVAYANHCGSDRDIRFFGGSCIVGPDGGDRVRAGATEGMYAARLHPEELRKAREKLKYLDDSLALARFAEQR